MNDAELLEPVLAAHGGLAIWRAVGRIDARFSSGGLAFALRWQAGKLLNHSISVFPHEMRVVIYDYPKPGDCGEWQIDAVGTGPIGQTHDHMRYRAREHFRGWIAQVRWDDLDLLYFAGYALWNYLSFPFLLCLDGVETTFVAGAGRTLLEVNFPPGFPTHCSRQFFHLDREGLLLRHDYVAEVFGKWAAAANFCRKSEAVDGLRLYARRRVVPSLGRSASLPFPTLVWIELDDISIHSSESETDLQVARGS
jgi:hypothetical protein